MLCYVFFPPQTRVFSSEAHARHTKEPAMFLSLKLNLFNVRLYIYHALINALSAHMIHINLNMIFYTHLEHSPTKRFT